MTRDLAVLTALSLAIAGCATHSPDVPTSSATAARQVPSIKVTTDCGECKVAPHIADFIAQGYRGAAAQSGATLLPKEEVTVVIKEYTVRGDAARLFAGALAGKDEIKAAVSYNGKQFMVEEYYRNAWLGIDDVAKRIGELTFERISR